MIGNHNLWYQYWEVTVIAAIWVMHIYEQTSNVLRPGDSIDHQTERRRNESVGLTVGLHPDINSYKGRS